ncbi:hypothetical protein [Methylobacterium sp. SyP6R]|uniref:hypothetical protein n=1 Tax=Methylobacterium sp. SyP6R TaxID=2718876 RepID=UPI001F258CD4|nr:hypothetical protein [Methylobacterium sp. SyP6R]MCF4129932.1 hypothetical protein [Methylobacterium sp. SyP6R]
MDDGEDEEIGAVPDQESFGTPCAEPWRRTDDAMFAWHRSLHIDRENSARTTQDLLLLSSAQLPVKMNTISHGTQQGMSYRPESTSIVGPFVDDPSLDGTGESPCLGSRRSRRVHVALIGNGCPPHMNFDIQETIRQYGRIDAAAILPHQVTTPRWSEIMKAALR